MIGWGNTGKAGDISDNTKTDRKLRMANNIITDIKSGVL